MYIPGICSVTFRKMAIPQIVKLTAESGLQAIEWGGDVHVPPNDPSAAESALRETKAAGLTISSYGSYYFVGEKNKHSFNDIIEATQRLQTNMIRVWPARIPPGDASPDDSQRVVDAARKIGDQTAKNNLEIAFEFHQGGLTEGNAAAFQLLAAINHPAVGIFWQPCHGQTMQYHLEGIRQLKPWLKNLHVFHWTKDGDSILRQALKDGGDAWKSFLAASDAPSQSRYALLEFVKNDDPEQFKEDAKTLIGMLNN